MSEAWSWALSIIGFVVIYLTGLKRSWAWLVQLAYEGLWIAYGVVTNQYGFIVSGFVIAALSFYNWLKWRSHELEAKARHW